jgi:hypothetical protein
MFKKNMWIVGLLAALAIIFVGCVDPLVEDTSGKIVEVANLQSIIADFDDGYIDNWGTVFAGTPFQKCGSPDFQIITEGGVKKLKIDNMTKGWGEGLDLYNNSNSGDQIVGVNFKAGDTIYIKGTINPVGNGLKLTEGGGKARFFDGWLGGATFEETFKFTATEVGSIKGSSPAALRISYADPDGGDRKGTIILEELIITGRRGSGDKEDKIDYTIPGNGSYKVPESTGLSIYVDLNNAIRGQLGSLAQAKITGPSKIADAADKDTGKLTVEFTQDKQSIFIPFTPEVKTLVVNAAKNGYSFNVFINGKQGTDASPSVPTWLRWCLGADRTGSWNITNMIGGSTADTFNTNQSLVVGSGGSNNLPLEITGIVMQCRPFNGNPAPALTPAQKITINSIQIQLVAGGPLTSLGTSISFSINKPGAGRLADKSIKGTNFTGLVTWFPELPRSGRFEKLLPYRAEIAIFPNPTYHANAVTSAAVSYTGTGTGTVTATYDQARAIVTTVYFEPTKAINELLIGSLWKLSEWFNDEESFNENNPKLSAPMVQAGGPTWTFNKATHTITFLNTKEDWQGLDLNFSQIDAGVDPALWKVGVTITGQVKAWKEGATSATMIAGGADGAYSWGGNVTVSALDTDFTITISEIPATWVTQNSDAIRINSQNGNAKSWAISEIVFTCAGQR